jgi:hypothetical protein
MGNTFNAQTYNAVPNAPAQAYGIQNFGAPSMTDYMQAFNPQMFNQPAFNPQGPVVPQQLSPQEQAYLATLDPFAAQAFLQSKGIV